MATEKETPKELAQWFVEKMDDLPTDCEKGNCGFKDKKGECCKWGMTFTLEKRIKDAVSNEIRVEATTAKSNDNDKALRNVNLQHDGHNSLDRISDILYQLDNWKLELKEVGVKNSSFPYVLAEYLRTHIKDMRFILNELYKNNKN